MSLYETKLTGLLLLNLVSFALERLRIDDLPDYPVVRLVQVPDHL